MKRSVLIGIQSPTSSEFWVVSRTLDSVRSASGWEG